MPREPAARDFKGQVAIERPSAAAGNLRGQVATEFMLYTAVFMFMAIAAFVVVGDLQRSEIPLSQNTVAKETGESFVSVITLAVKGGEGFSYNYTFPRTVFGRTYRMDMRLLDAPEPSIMMDWAGDYGNFSYQYGMPDYEYKIEGSCLAAPSLEKPADVLDSSYCSNTIMLVNDGENLTITQLP
ncbi:MAG: hypothetical protein AB1295_03115 [Candidatus Micrarchaeota archaeon]